MLKPWMKVEVVSICLFFIYFYKPCTSRKRLALANAREELLTPFGQGGGRPAPEPTVVPTELVGTAGDEAAGACERMTATNT